MKLFFWLVGLWIAFPSVSASFFCLCNFFWTLNIYRLKILNCVGITWSSQVGMSSDRRQTLVVLSLCCLLFQLPSSQYIYGTLLHPWHLWLSWQYPSSPPTTEAYCYLFQFSSRLLSFLFILFLLHLFCPSFSTSSKVPPSLCLPLPFCSHFWWDWYLYSHFGCQCEGSENIANSIAWKPGLTTHFNANTQTWSTYNSDMGLNMFRTALLFLVKYWKKSWYMSNQLRNKYRRCAIFKEWNTTWVLKMRKPRNFKQRDGPGN